MPDLRMIRISLATTNNNVPTQPSEPNAQEMQDNNGKTNETATIFKSLIIGKGFETAKRLIIQGVDVGLNRQFSINEDYMGETTYQNAKNVIGKVTSIASTIGGGTLAGAQVGGLWGAAIGFGISAIGVGVSETLSVQGKMSQTFRSLNASNVELNYARARAGLTDGSMGTEN